MKIYCDENVEAAIVEGLRRRNIEVISARESGNLVGFVYGEDGTTPVEGAVVKMRNISSGSNYESTTSNKLGVFKLEGQEDNSSILLYSRVS